MFNMILFLGTNGLERGHYISVTRDMESDDYFLSNDSAPPVVLTVGQRNKILGKCHMFAYSCEDALPAGPPPPFSHHTAQHQPGPSGDHHRARKEPAPAPPPIPRPSSEANLQPTVSQSCDNQSTKGSHNQQQPDPVSSDPDELPEPGYVPKRRTKPNPVTFPPPAL